MTPLVVFSHLRWSFVYQRPQHLLSRLQRHRPVLFIEEPVQADGPPRLEIHRQGLQLEVAVPHTPLPAQGFDAAQIELLMPLVRQVLLARSLAPPLAWLYTPMALPLAQGICPQALVYDCMDELAAFKNAPPLLGQRERELLAQADLVLTGGPSLYRAKQALNPNTHCLPSSVDAAHFARPAAKSVPGTQAQALERAHALQGALPRPRLGFFGVIDERLDIELLAGLARARPDWQIVMVGPVVKIDPASLPQAPNLHWLGGQPYQDLPALMAGWDLCIMPFALNESTRFISPTKTLEYLAGGQPVVSTPVADVALLYGTGVRIAEGVQAFVQACAEALAETPVQRLRREAAGRALVAAGSWDRSADKVQALLQRLEQRNAQAAQSLQASA